MERECTMQICIRSNRWEPTEWVICDEDYDGPEEVKVINLLCNKFPGVPNLNNNP